MIRFSIKYWPTYTSKPMTTSGFADTSAGVDKAIKTLYEWYGDNGSRIIEVHFSEVGESFIEDEEALDMIKYDKGEEN